MSGEESPEPKVLAFHRRGASGSKPDQPVSAEPIARRLDSTSVPPPTDGLVLACACGGTVHEMLNAGVIRCCRCARVAPGIYWKWEKGPAPSDTNGRK